jgi:hypothetical protein
MVPPFVVIGIVVVFGLSGGGVRCLERTLRAPLAKVSAATQYGFVLAHDRASAPAGIVWRTVSARVCETSSKASLLRM